MNRRRSALRTLGPLAAALAAGCATVPPPGPATTALPGTGKTPARFQADDASCRGQAAARFSGADGNAAGTDTGLRLGPASGTGDAWSSGRWAAQRRYDQAYLQCMYAFGHQVPLAAVGTQALPRGIPPPPPGRPPPPPPGVVPPVIVGPARAGIAPAPAAPPSAPPAVAPGTAAPD